MTWNNTQPSPTQLISAGQGTILNNFQFLGNTAGNAANGFYKLPNGLILNWGTGSVPNDSTGLVVSFAQAYTSDVYGIFLQLIRNTSTGQSGSTRTLYVKPGATLTTAGFTALVVSTTTPEDIYWFAIGK